MKPFDINFLDHVAIRVKDINDSVNWYSKVLGLTIYKLEKWGEFPIFMLSGKSGIAIFPATLDDDQFPMNSKNIKIDHFAFNVSNEDFIKAKTYFNEINEAFIFQDHHYFHSIYLKDPDNHTVELTTLLIDENQFYK
ncbi:VOC family protein [Yeosuana marina]|uniref:VOC family protein n=1 Tax=Yeosuana marina TaxID=1565536 RepID=UPI001420D880|nr:VOC family protein [Yeosuana marina]